MGFVKVDPIAEAMELQDMFKDDAQAKEMFHQYELAHRERMIQEQPECKDKLVG